MFVIEQRNFLKRLRLVIQSSLTGLGKIIRNDEYGYNGSLHTLLSLYGCNIAIPKATSAGNDGETTINVDEKVVITIQKRATGFINGNH